MDELDFRHEADPDNPGWMTWDLQSAERFNAFLQPLRVRREGDFARCRIVPDLRHSNIGGNVHGGALLGFIDISLFAGAHMLGLENAIPAITVETSVQFIGAARIGEPLDAVVEILRETGRLVFLRGIVEQEADRVAAFSGVIRKVRSAR